MFHHTIWYNHITYQPEAALGILTYAQRRLGSVVTVKESWLAKLGHWEQALELYRTKVNSIFVCEYLYVYVHKSLAKLGHWEQALELYRTKVYACPQIRAYSFLFYGPDASLQRAEVILKVPKYCSVMYLFNT